MPRIRRRVSSPSISHLHHSDLYDPTFTSQLQKASSHKVYLESFGSVLALTLSLSVTFVCVCLCVPRLHTHLLLNWTETKRCLQSLRCFKALKFSLDDGASGKVAAVSRQTSKTGKEDGTCKVLDSSHKLLSGFYFLILLSNGAAPLSKL